MANLRIGRRSGLVLRGGKNRRSTFWFSGVDTSSTITAPSTAVALTSLNAAALALRPFTVVRTRGILHLRSDQNAVTEVQAAAYGQIIVSDQAVAIGITALPTPVTDDQSTWFVYEWMMTALQFATAASFVEIGASKEIDSRAMRKVEEGQDLVEVIESATITNGLIFRSFSRNLIKLH